MARMIALIQALLDPRCYPHPVQHVQLVETHISWLLLTGTYAYKIKKPVDLGFADFSTLDKRLHCCSEEVRLNRRFAPDIYLGVVPIVGTPNEPAVDAPGSAIEYAVKMREFDQRDLFLTRLLEHRVDPGHIDALADACVAFHANADTAAATSPFGAPDALLSDALANFDAIVPRIADEQLRTRIDALRHWTLATHQRQQSSFIRRQTEKRIRECHGDLHLRNIILARNRITLFDCIEFNEQFRRIDVMNELAFTAMDLTAQGRFDYSCRLINRYLETGGDYHGLGVLPFYLVYRAMVRAKVDWIHAGQSDVGEDTQARERQDFADRITLAERYAQPSHPFIAITSGLSGSGKTYLSQLALERTGAIRLRSDIERKRLSGLAADACSGSDLNTGLYSPSTSDRTFEHLAHLARVVIAAGFPVIVDATFIHHGRRTVFADLAATLAVPFVILHCQAQNHVVEARIAKRRAARADASEADVRVLRHQRQSAEPFTRAEQAAVIQVDTENDASIGAALDRLDRLRRRV